MLAVQTAPLDSLPISPLDTDARSRNAWAALGTSSSVSSRIDSWKWSEFKRLANETAQINGLRVEVVRRSVADSTIHATARFAGVGCVERAVDDFRMALRYL